MCLHLSIKNSGAVGEKDRRGEVEPQAVDISHSVMNPSIQNLKAKD